MESNNDCRMQLQFSFMVLFSLPGIAYSNYSDGWQRRCRIMFNSVVRVGAKKKKNVSQNVWEYFCWFRTSVFYNALWCWPTHTNSQHWQESESWTVASTYWRWGFRILKGVQEEAGLWHKDLWCADVTSWKPVNLFDVGSLLVNLKGKTRQAPPAVVDVGRREASGGRTAANEHRSQRMLWSVIA